MKFKIYNYQTGEIVESEETCAWISDELERRTTEQHIFRADWLEKYLQIFESEIYHYGNDEEIEGTLHRYDIHQYSVHEYLDDETPHIHYEITVIRDN